MEDPPDHAIPQFGDTLHNVLDRQAEWQKTWILDLDPVIKQSHSDGCALLGVVRMDDGIHQRLPDCYEGNRPTILPADTFDDRFASQVLMRKRDRFFRGARQERADLC